MNPTSRGPLGVEAKIYCRRRALLRPERGGASTANFTTFLQPFRSCNVETAAVKNDGWQLNRAADRPGRHLSVSIFRINRSFYGSSGQISVSLTRRECKSAAAESRCYLLPSCNHWLSILVKRCINDLDAINGVIIMNEMNT